MIEIDAVISETDFTKANNKILKENRRIRRQIEEGGRWKEKIDDRSNIYFFFEHYTFTENWCSLFMERIYHGPLSNRVSHSHINSVRDLALCTRQVKNNAIFNCIYAPNVQHSKPFQYFSFFVRILFTWDPPT